MATTVGTYLARRFEDVGLRHYFMVPGDYNLVLLDELLRNKHLEQIGCCNELNAAYAAEGYARANGVGALVVTFNVGALSAINGVAGAYAERLPVIFVTAGCNTNDPLANHLVHHSLGTHDLSYQYEMLRQVTCAAVRILHAEDAPRLIDHAFRKALRERKPAYIEIACNLSTAPCADPPPFETVSTSEPSSPPALAAAVDAAAKLLDDAKRPLLLAGPLLRSYAAIEAFRELAEALGCAVAVMPAAKGLFSEDDAQFIGIYWGGVSSPGCEPIVDWADMVLAAGPMFTDYSTVGWTAMPAHERLIEVGPRTVRCPQTEYTDVAMAELLSGLARRVRKNDTTLVQYRRESRRTAPVQVAREHVRSSVLQQAERGATADGNGGARGDAPLTRIELFRQVERALDDKTTLLVETGDSWFNGMYLHLPAGGRFEIEMQWGSIGWAVPATFGYAMGLDKDRRLVSVIGDGSFQLTAQEVANMIRYGQRTLIFLVNNRGYVIESEIHDGPYNYIKNWDYAGLVSAWNAEDGHGLGLKATTGAELARAIEIAGRHEGGPVLIECQIAHDDCSPQLLKWGTRVALANERPPVHV
jgi:pyruvate decarboxylase/indolepyruvate decarboxylase